MSAELAILNQIKQNKDMYVVSESDFNPHTMVDVSGMFPLADLTTGGNKKVVLDIEEEDTEYINTVDNVDPFDDDSGVALYRFDDNVNDKGGNHNGTATGITYPTGVFGKSAASDSIGDNVTYPTTMLSGLTAVSYSIWFKFLSSRASTSYQVGIWVRSSDDNNRFRLYQYGTNSFMNIHFVINGSSHNSSNIPITEDTWYHLIVTIGDGAFRVYIDNVWKYSYSGDVFDLSTISDITTHNVPNSSSYDSDCEISQLRVFNKVLTRDEMQTLFQEKVER